ncbi:MAG: class I SAM-dependent methyltransferase [Gemmataceae bacterium]
MSEVKRLNWGCGRSSAPGWINSDRNPLSGVDIVADILEGGLPLADESMDYVVSIHALEEVPIPDLVPVLRELRRVLKTGGRLRLVLPDLDRGIRAYQNNKRDYFLIPDEDAKSIGSKFIMQLLWYGYSRSLFTGDFLEELLQKAGFREIFHCGYQQTSGPNPEIVELDSRPDESLFIEAIR